MTVDASVSVTSNFGEATQMALAGILRGETLAAERLLALSLPRTPLRDGLLRGSGAVIPAVDPQEGAAVTYDTPYAARLHEHPEYNFSQPGTGGKYLENPAMESSAELGKIIATEAGRG
jgi:hypothetical protein